MNGKNSKITRKGGVTNKARHVKPKCVEHF